MVDLKIIKGTERAQGWFHLMYQICQECLKITQLQVSDDD